MSRRSCIRCGDYIPGGGVELCEKCTSEVQSSGKFGRLLVTLLVTASLAAVFYYVWFK